MCVVRDWQLNRQGGGGVYLPFIQLGDGNLLHLLRPARLKCSKADPEVQLVSLELNLLQHLLHTTRTQPLPSLAPRAPATASASTWRCWRRASCSRC